MKVSTSKALAIALVIFGCCMTVAYYILIGMGFTVDPAIGVASISEIVGVMLTYCIYNLKLKDSRNKYGIDADGVPWDKVDCECNKQTDTNDEEANYAEDK